MSRNNGDLPGNEDWPHDDESCTEPDSDIYLEQIAHALQQQGLAKYITVAKVISSAKRAMGQFYHRSELAEFRTALYFDNRTKALDRIHSDRFIQSVSKRFAINTASPAWKYVAAEIDSESIGENSIPVEPEAFWASRPGAVYISSGPGSICKVTAEGSKFVDNGTDGVLFPRGATLRPWKLCSPKDPFQNCELFSSLSTTAGHGPLLAKLWAMSLPTNPRNKPPLCCSGSVGSGKTRFATGLCEFFGMPVDGRLLKVTEDGEEEFWTAANAGGIEILDNADTRTKWLADAIAAAATGGSRVKRKLYSDSDQITLRPRSWIIITTAKPDTFAGDAGLADRMLKLGMGRRTGQTQDSQLSAQISDSRDAGLSWICEHISIALADTSLPSVSLNSRHPDFATFAYRLGRALDLETETVDALSAAETDKSQFCIESDPACSPVLAFLKGYGKFEGSTKDLIEKMLENGHLDKDTWITPKKLGRRLDEVWPHLQVILSLADRRKDRTNVWRYSLSIESAMVVDEMDLKL